MRNKKRLIKICGCGTRLFTTEVIWKGPQEAPANMKHKYFMFLCPGCKSSRTLKKEKTAY